MKKITNYIVSFSKLITIAWVCAWLETLLFTQIATLFHLGDASAIQYINDNVVQIGLIICGFYFSTKCVENVAQGYEEFVLTKHETINQLAMDDCDVIIDEPEPTQNVEVKE